MQIFGMRVSISGAKWAGIHSQIQELFPLRFSRELVVSCAVALVPSQALPLDFGGLLSPNPVPEVWPHAKFPAKRKILRVQFCGTWGIAEARAALSQVRADRETRTNPDFYYFSFFSFLSVSP